MTTEANEGGWRRIPPGVLIAVIAILVLVSGVQAFLFFRPAVAGGGRPLTAKEKTEENWLNQKASETGGDFNKLSPEDQRRLLAAHGPQAPFILRQTAAASAQSTQSTH